MSQGASMHLFARLDDPLIQELSDAVSLISDISYTILPPWPECRTPFLHLANPSSARGRNRARTADPRVSRG